MEQKIKKMDYGMKLVLACAAIWSAGITEVFAQENRSRDLVPGKVQHGIGGDSLIQKFVFRDSLDREVRLSDFKGSLVLVDMFFTGCGACITVAEAMRTVHDALKQEPVVFVSLSTDKNREVWLQSIRKNAGKSSLNPWAGSYWATEGTVMLYTGGSGNDNEFCSTYVPDRFYPKLLLIDREGRLVRGDVPRPDKDPSALISYLSKQL